MRPVMGILTGVSLEIMYKMPLQKDGFQNYMYTVDDKYKRQQRNINKLGELGVGKLLH